MISGVVINEFFVRFLDLKNFVSFLFLFVFKIDYFVMKNVLLFVFIL